MTASPGCTAGRRLTDKLRRLRLRMRGRLIEGCVPGVVAVKPAGVAAGSSRIQVLALEIACTTEVRGLRCAS